jgi:MoxR-like ATPase
MPAVAAPAIDAIVAKFKGALDFQDQRLVERRHALWIAQVGLVARQHTIYHGKPGNAKSMTVDGILKHFPELKLVKTQAYKASTPEQFLGPISFKAMENDEYRRITRNKFPDCEVYFCDETTRAPKPVLTAFQGGMVEREFDNGAGPQPIPLMSFVGTVNHLPDDEELEAFIDRFLFKIVVKAPRAQESIAAILRGGIERRRNPSISVVPDELLITRAELVTLQSHADTAVDVPEEFTDMLAELYSNLVGIGIEPSLRRLDALVAGVQAAAAIDGRDQVMQDDILIAADSLWTAESEIENVRKETTKFASAWLREAAELQESYDESRDTLTGIQAKVAKLSSGEPIPREVTNEGIDIVNEQVRLKELVEKHIAAASGRDTSNLDQMLAEMDAAATWVEKKLLGGLSLR